MMNKKVLSLLLCFALALSVILPGVPTMAAEEESPADKGMAINKTAVDNGDGTYTIQLEAYATGAKVVTEINKDVPTDIVLVLDQSGSMAQNMGQSTSYSFEPYPYSSNRVTYGITNAELYRLRHNGNGDNGNLWYPLSNGGYASVSVTITPGEPSYTYTEITNYRNNSEWYTSLWDYNDSESLYAKIDGSYKLVTVTRSGGFWSGYTYSYAIDGVTTITSSGNSSTPNFQSIAGFEGLFARSVETIDTYAYTCTDSDGNTINIGESVGAETEFTGSTLYRSVSTTTNNTKLDALKTALNTFTAEVNEKASGEDGEFGTDDDIDHRIAVVGFASGNRWNSTNYNYGNTEVFIGSQQYRYGTQAESVYTTSFQNMSTEAGRNNVAASINALAADGGTLTNLGMEMANDILIANPVNNENRNRVVVVFTDGVPGWSGYDSDVAGSAITQGAEVKANGVTVYTVGVFSGADATSAGNANGDETQKANWFMQHLSSNTRYPQTPSYYLSAADATTLNNIFKQIAENIESGGSNSTLDSNAVIKDIIAPSFELPEGASAEDITVESYSCIEVTKLNDGTSTYEFASVPNNVADSTTVSIDGSQVNVTGFDFSANYCGTNIAADGSETKVGSKLVIKFDVVVRDGFLGGNEVFTNTNAAIYVDDQTEDPFIEFNRPDVDVAINEISVTAPDKNVYLLGDLTAAEIKSGASVSVGTVPLDLTAENYGLQDWQNKYVDIAVTYTDAAGNAVTDLNDLKEDTTYTVTATVSPKTEGTAVAQTGTDKGNIYVFKPTLTYKDTTVYYGDTAPTGYTGNEVSVLWKHGEEEAPATMGAAPALDKSYALVNGNDVVNGRINSKKDIPVKVTSVKIDGTDVTGYVTFAHEDCKTGEDLLDGNFLLHPQTVSLTITKTGGTAGEPYVFNVKKDGALYTQVTIFGNDSVTIKELPVGTYSIEEDESWSWRFNGTYDKASVELSSKNTSGIITCTNTSDNNQWLNAYAAAKNVFDKLSN